ncbi:MAG: 3-dehydroquinate synthase [Clostridia bacterium]|nr:3-dehydroquinate synthase [Clostridia bacterium]
MIPVCTALGNYDIVLQNGALSQIGTLLDLDRKVLIVTDDGVPSQYGEAVAKASKTPVTVTIKQGEASKCMAQFENLLAVMLQNDFTRKDCVVAVGGGVVGDLSSFAASCYMRGIDFYNVPTTLLSQVDSSIGGKTAVDFNGVKNIIGAFYQPKRVVIDPETLRTLDERQLHAGLTEAVKMAITNDAQLFEIIENSADLQNDLPEIIARALNVKKTVVEEDPTEKGLRRVLNFGHTIGHAVESAANGALLHGECVALGMLPLCDAKMRSRVIAVLKKYDLPTEITFKTEDLMPYLMHDKKRAAAKIITVLSDEIGTFRFCEMSPDEILSRVEEEK